MGKYKKLAGNTIVIAVGNFAAKTMSFLLLPIFTSLLTPAEYGMADILYTSIDLILPVFSICIIEAVFRFAIDKTSEKKEILSIGLRTMIFANVIFLSLLPILLAFKVETKVILAYGFFFFGYSLNSLILNFTRGIEKIVQFVLGGIISAALVLASSLVFIKVLKLGLTGYILSYGVGSLISALFLFISGRYWRYLGTGFNKALFKEMAIYSVYLIPNSISWFLVNTSNRYIIVAICGVGLSGIYAVATKLPALINIASSIFQQAWQISAVKEQGKSDSAEYQSKVFKFYNTGMLLACSALILVNPYISKILLRNSFYEGWVYSGPLIVSAYIGSIGYFFGTVYVVIKNNKMSMLSTLTGGAVTMLTTGVLVKFIGIVGAAYGSIMGYLVIAIFRMIDSRKHIKIKYNLMNLVFGVSIILLQALSWVYLQQRIAMIVNIICASVLIMLNARYILNIIKLVFTYLTKRRVKAPLDLSGDRIQQFVKLLRLSDEQMLQFSKLDSSHPAKKLLDHKASKLSVEYFKIFNETITLITDYDEQWIMDNNKHIIDSDYEIANLFINSAIVYGHVLSTYNNLGMKLSCVIDKNGSYIIVENDESKIYIDILHINIPAKISEEKQENYPSEELYDVFLYLLSNGNNMNLLKQAIYLESKMEKHGDKAFRVFWIEMTEFYNNSLSIEDNLLKLNNDYAKLKTIQNNTNEELETIDQSQKLLNEKTDILSNDLFGSDDSANVLGVVLSVCKEKILIKNTLMNDSKSTSLMCELLNID